MLDDGCCSGEAEVPAAEYARGSEGAMVAWTSWQLSRTADLRQKQRYHRCDLKSGERRK